MNEHPEPDQNLENKDEKTRERRNLVVVFLGFLLLGLALGLLFFGGDIIQSIFGGNGESASVEDGSILDQAGDLAALPPGEAQIVGDSGAGGVLEVGDIAHDFELEDFDGNRVKLSDYRGKPVIINFWATWCAPCRLEMPELQEAFENYEEEGLVILALDQDEPIERAREFFYDEMELSFTPLLDENSAVSTAYSSFSVLPTTYFVNPDGTVTSIHRGPLTMSQIEGYVKSMTPEAS
jgi:cytochrome c biogenesis protein CcmG/thiol:disulfide interchange protein DsbE